MPNWPTEPVITNQVVYYLNYYVYSRDPADTEALRTQFQGYGTLRRPAYMRDTLAIPETAFGYQVDAEPRAIGFQYPPTIITRSIPTGAWSKAPVRGTYVYPPNPSSPGDPYWWPPLSHVFDYDQDWFEVPASPSVPIWGAGRPLLYIWSCTFLSMGGQSSVGPGETPPPTLKPIKNRRWIAGFELYNQSNGFAWFSSPEGIAGAVNPWISRDASRTPDGLGLAVRSLTSIMVDYLLTRNGSVTDSRRSWERIYLRLRRLPTTGASNGVTFIQYYGTNGTPGISLRINSDGSISIWKQIHLGSPTLVSTSAPLTLNRWYRMDTLLEYLDSGLNTVANCLVSLKGPTVTSASATGEIVTNVNGTALQQTRLGNGVTGANDLEYDLDDWSNREYPDDGSGLDLNRMDYIFGSHIQAMRPTGLDTGTNWTGDFRAAGQQTPSPGNALLTSTTALAKYIVDTEFDGSPLGEMAAIIQMGLIAFMGTASAHNAGVSALGGVGYDSTITGEVITATQINMTGAVDSFDSLATPAAGSILPPELADVGPIKAIFRHENGTALNTIKQLMAVGEFLGSWGPEDEEDPTDAPGITDVLGIHNAPYFNSFMARATPPPISSLGIAGGTYTGNGTGQTITIDLPAVHFLFIRRVDSTGGRATWYSSMIDVHDRVYQGNFFSNMMGRIRANTDGTVSFEVSGTADANTSGATYQYIAVCDISSRIMINSAFSHQDGTNSNPLFIPTFTPELVFLLQEVLTAGAASGIYMKGPGHAGAFATILDQSNQTNNIATFATGAVVSGTGLNLSNASQIASSAWRQTDGNITPNPCFIGQYTGNGGGARTLSFDFGGRRPMFAIIQPVTGAGEQSWFRDPSHTGSNSSQIAANSQDTSHITGGGIDQIIVGTNLNANAIVYNVFCIAADTDACNNGWGCNGSFGLAQPGWDPGDLPPEYLTPPLIPADVNLLGSGGLVFSGEAPKLVVTNLSGLYTIIPGKRNDTILTRNTTTTDETDIAFPEPFGETGYLGG